MGADPATQGERLKALEVQMRELIGNGQPGRMDRAEADIRGILRLLYIGFGMLLLAQFVFGTGLIKLR